jgi:hypothetical protein
MFDGEYTRRTLLRQAAVTAGAGTVASTAGCSGLNPLGGGGGAYASWLPVPDELGDSDHYSFTYLDMETVESNEDDLDDDSFDPDSIETFWEPLGFDWEDTSTLLIVSQVTVIEAEFSREDAVSDLEDEDFEEDTDHEGYTIFLGPSESRTFAIGDNTVLLAGGYGVEEPVDQLEVVIDANNGNVDRYGDENEDMSALLDELGGTLDSGNTMEESDSDNPESGAFENMVAWGRTSTINGETSDRKWVIVYDEEDDVDTGDLEDWVDANSDGEFDGVDDISYNQNGRKGIVTGTSDTDEL